MDGKPRILVINGSPRKYGSSMQLSIVAAKGVVDAGGIPEIVSLYDYRIKPCMGCVSDGNKYCRFPCVIKDDDFNTLAGKLLESHGVIISTPVYWYAPSGVLKNFIDRLTSMEHMIFHKGRSLLEGKVAGFIATGLDSGVMMAISYLAIVMSSMGAHVIPWSMAYSHLEDITRDEQALRDSYNVGYIAAKTARALMSYEHIGYNPLVDVKELAELARRYTATEVAERERRIGMLEDLSKD
ncbi:flavodoxin family protein [Desulfurococcus mucosus]|uniref:NADPH-dependent FMN reductase n=1 Tax=Desulfurococcus mucosus (strain ATCC 35584 / DSM 2162 / JCM 9187 / O7/1) TaxID=765177 RepID=E8R7V4_DESM0|nr:flavodoxin family protein [Desulfurococcus mucosus]ADV64580.1 NADPH-dependent FMN reductase [Desulfurococcus mucosus DSM 2162]